MPKHGLVWLQVAEAERSQTLLLLWFVTLRLFIDSADQGVWAELLPLGLFAGITTNPTLLKRTGVASSVPGLQHLVGSALELGCKELHLQAWGSTSAEFLACGRALAALAPGMVVVKLPLIEQGLQAASTLVQADERVTLTACFGVSQALVAAALQTTYVAPYLGRISTGGADGIAEVSAMQRCLAGVGSRTRLLVASLRSVEDLIRLAPCGIDTYTLAPNLIRQLWANRATDAAVAQFERDAKEVGRVPGEEISSRGHHTTR